MAPAAAFGIAGDFLTLLGGMISLVDAIFGERLFRTNRGRFEAWEKLIEDPELPPGTLSLHSVNLNNYKDIGLAFQIAAVRRSRLLAIVGAAVLSVGFLCLLLSRLVA